MAATTRIEMALDAAIAAVDGAGCPPKLAKAVRYAIFPGGARIRPRLCYAVAEACGDDQPAITDAAACAIEMLHCASLVHDDMPCFDDASHRRGKPSVHKAFDERVALLTGDALIVLAFQTLAREVAIMPVRWAPLQLVIARAVGMPLGIVAGQAWECEPAADLSAYHRAKTGALFAAATLAGAAAAGAPAAAWQTLGERIGEAYQVADDIRDAVGNAEELGKPVGRDKILGRPSAVLEIGLDGSIGRLKELVAEAVGAIPACPGASALKAHILSEASRLLPKDLAQRAA